MNIARKMLKKVIAILILMSIITTNFAITGNAIVSYAVDAIETTKINNENIEMRVYFENESGEKVTSIEIPILILLFLILKNVKIKQVKLIKS